MLSALTLSMARCHTRPITLIWVVSGTRRILIPPLHFSHRPFTVFGAGSSREMGFRHNRAAPAASQANSAPQNGQTIFPFASWRCSRHSCGSRLSTVRYIISDPGTATISALIILFLVSSPAFYSRAASSLSFGYQPKIFFCPFSISTCAPKAFIAVVYS